MHGFVFNTGAGDRARALMRVQQTLTDPSSPISFLWFLVFFIPKVFLLH